MSQFYGAMLALLCMFQGWMNVNGIHESNFFKFQAEKDGEITPVVNEHPHLKMSGYESNLHAKRIYFDQVGAIVTENPHQLPPFYCLLLCELSEPKSRKILEIKLKQIWQYLQKQL